MWWLVGTRGFKGINLLHNSRADYMSHPCTFRSDSGTR